MNSFITFGEILKHYRTEAHLSQEELSLGICDRKYISKIERNICIPTLDMVNQLSAKIGINLYDAYATMLYHHDRDTHSKIELINEYSRSKETIAKLPELIAQYSSLPGFQSGEPKQALMYAEASYYSNVKKDRIRSQQIAKEGLLLHYRTERNLLKPDNIFSNIELCLFLVLAVDACREKDYENGKKYFSCMLHFLNKIFALKHYSLNRNYHFEQNLMASVVYNMFTFFRDDPVVSYETIVSVIDRMRSLNNSYRLPELMLCKSYFECKQDNLELAKKTYQMASTFIDFYYPTTDFELTKKIVLGEYYQLLN